MLRSRAPSNQSRSHDRAALGITPAAALLATIGLYGVMAYAVARRTREIGMRMALGAEKQSVLWMVMRQVSLLVAIGLGVGIPAAFVLARLVSRWISSMLFGVLASDPASLGAGSVARASQLVRWWRSDTNKPGGFLGRPSRDC